MIVISFVFVLKISCVQAQNIMGDETSQEENCEQLNWTLENGILIISGQGKIPMDFFEDNSIDPDQPKELIIFNRLQKLNAYQSIVSTPSGIQILSRLAQFSNAAPLILFSPFDNFTYFNLLHSRNASLPW